MSNEQIVIKTASREIVRGRASGTFLTFSIPLEHKNGYVFLLADIDSACKISARVVGLLREAVERLGRSLPERSHLQHRFEQTLQSVNDDLKDMVNVKTCPPESLNIVIGVLKQNSFILSAAGNLPALFLRRTAQQRFKVFDLQRNISTETGKIKLEKLFNVVLDGDLVPDDILLLASRDLHRLVSVEDIHPLISTLPPGSALETIEQYLPQNAKLAMLLFQIRKEKEVLTGFGPEVSSDASMNALSDTENTTEKMLDLEKPHIYQALLKFIKSVSSNDKIERKEVLGRLSKKMLLGSKSYAVLMLKVIKNIPKYIVHVVNIVFSKNKDRSKTISAVRNAWSKTWKTSKSLRLNTMTGKLFLSGAIFFILTLAGTVYYFHVGKIKEADDKAFLEQLVLADEKYDSASASIIYKDESSARIFLKDAVSILSSVNVNGDEARQQEVDQRLSKIETEMSRIRKIITTDIASTPIINNTVSSYAGSYIFLEDGSIKTIKEGQLVDIRTSDKNTQLKMSTIFEGNVVGVNTSDSFVSFNASDNAVVPVGINTAENEAENARDMSHFGQRLYVLSGNTIYRHQRVEGGDYGPGVSWITDGANIEYATDIAIDGTVWLAGGQSLKHFDAGKEVGVNVASIDPPFSNIVDIWTEADVPVVLILDAGQNRVIAYRKDTGDMIGQIINPAWNSGISVHADPATKTAVVVTPSTIHTFSIVNLF